MPTLQKPKKKKRKKNCSNGSSKLYNLPEYKKLRAAYIMEHPLCEMCLKEGKTTPIQEVHHIRPFGWATTEEE